MRIADLYIRVSTDEQADKGYSQRNQEEVLRRYCDMNYIQVRKVVYEDHSAKTFNRPAWSKLLADLHLRGKINYALHINSKDEEMLKYKELIQTFFRHYLINCVKYKNRGISLRFFNFK